MCRAEGKEDVAVQEEERFKKRVQDRQSKPRPIGRIAEK
jgi:hypothetical protein